jgi:iron complex outermembrane recepter protein
MTVSATVHRVLAVAAFVVCLASPGALFAQATAAPPLEEITVQARKVTEKLQDVPISITALTGDDLEARGAQNLAAVAQFAPNLQVDGTAAVSGSSVASTIFIRGIGQTDFTLNSDPGVGVYIDGVYVARSIGSLLDLIDVQSIEVLRGPQGTLFGKNTIGGALNVTSRPPSSERSGYVNIQGGNFARRHAKARLDAPLSDTVLTSLSVASLQEDGYQERILEPSEPDLGNLDRVVARGRLLWTPVDRFSADVIVDYSRGREQSVAQSVLVIEPNTGAPFLAAAAGLIPGTTPTIRPGFEDQVSAGSLLDGTFLSTDPDRAFYAGPSRSDFDITGTSATLTYDFSNVQLKSISAYRHLMSNFARDSASSAFVVADTYDDYRQTQWSQEMQLSGALPSAWGNYVAGIFYLHETGSDSNLVATSIGDLQSGGSVDNDSLAFFAQTNLKLTERLGATVGARYTNEEKGFTPGYAGGEQAFHSNANGLALGLPPSLPLILDGDYQSHTHRTDYTLSLQYKITKDLMTYISHSTGFKSGGFSQRIGPGGAGIPAPSFRPETVRVAEVGLKWIGLGGRLRINSAAFYTDYKDVQITPIFEGIGPVTRNAGDAEIVGGEIDWAFAPNRDWALNGGLGLLSTRYKSLTPEALVNVNLDGSPILTLDSDLAKSPKTSANLTIARHWDVLAGHQLTASVDGSYTSELFNDVLNSPELRRPSLTLLGAALSLTTADENWNASLRGVNLTDKRYIIAGNAERYAGNIGYTQATYARPREWWVEVRRNF